MKSRLLLCVLLTVAGCASKGPSKGEIASIESQTFKTNIPGETIKITKSCGWLWNRKQCNIEAIEAVGVQPSVGATNLIQKTVTLQACDNARANVVSYVFGDSVTDSRISKLRSRQNENQKDRLKSRTEKGDEVAMSDSDPEKDTNFSIQESLVNSDIDMVRTVTTNAQGRLVGFKVINTSVVNGKTIACTINWSKNDTEDLRKIRGLISGT